MNAINRFPDYDFLPDGLVISRVRNQPRVMKPIRMGDYVGLQLRRADGHSEKAYLHRLICEAFYGPCPNGMECRHLDGDKNNNAAANLAWGSKKDNSNDKKLHGTSPLGERNPMAKLTRDKVSAMRDYRAQTSASYKAIANKFGVSTMTAWRAVTEKSWRDE